MLTFGSDCSTPVKYKQEAVQLLTGWHHMILCTCTLCSFFKYFRNSQLFYHILTRQFHPSQSGIEEMTHSKCDQFKKKKKKSSISTASTQNVSESLLPVRWQGSSCASPVVKPPTFPSKQYLTLEAKFCKAWILKLVWTFTGVSSVYEIPFLLYA